MAAVMYAVVIAVIYFLLELTETSADDNELDHPALSVSDASIIMVVCGVLCVAMIVFDIVYAMTTQQLYKRYNTPRQELMNLLNDKENVIEKTTLQQRVRAVLAMPLEKVDPNVTKFLKGISEAGASCTTEFVVGARDCGALPIRKDNRLNLPGRRTNLHISELRDLYGNPMYLAAAPLPTQFADQWEAIWQAKIGVIVWIGRFWTHESRMKPYVELKEGSEVKYGNFRIRTVESGDLVYKFALYYVQAYRGREKRDLIIMHAYEWLQESVTWALERDVELINCIKEEHTRRIRSADLCGVMFQCKFGTAGSASMLAAYLGYQTWMKSGRVNLYGILQYIRKMRAMAFEQTGDKDHPFLVQVKVAYATMYGMAKYCDSQKISRYERWIRDVLCKEAV